MRAGEGTRAWKRWVRRPQQVPLRRALFQIHLWSGVTLGLYIFFISLTGSVLVYRNEFYAAASTDTQIWLISTLIELHADLLAGPVGRKVNGIGAFAVLLSALTGFVIWWPGIKRWRRSLVVRRGVGLKRLIWDLHSAVGIWTLAFTLVFAVSGIYLSFPLVFHSFVDWYYGLGTPPPRPRFLDDALAWLAYSHFGRINGIGLFCSGPGVCDQTTKAVWAVFGIAPAAMFVTGTIMWWNRVVRRWLRGSSRQPPG
ncbi:MAG: PepSY-associated TM helix domain-containing protein [Gammaproteobacteria bacterium]